MLNPTPNNRIVTRSRSMCSPMEIETLRSTVHYADCVTHIDRTPLGMFTSGKISPRGIHRAAFFISP